MGHAGESHLLRILADRRGVRRPVRCVRHLQLRARRVLGADDRGVGLEPRRLYPVPLTGPVRDGADRLHHRRLRRPLGWAAVDARWHGDLDGGTLPDQRGADVVAVAAAQRRGGHRRRRADGESGGQRHPGQVVRRAPRRGGGLGGDGRLLCRGCPHAAHHLAGRLGGVARKLALVGSGGAGADGPCVADDATHPRGPWAAPGRTQHCRPCRRPRRAGSRRLRRLHDTRPGVANAVLLSAGHGRFRCSPSTSWSCCCTAFPT